jgi:Peptidase_C39 like family
MLMRHKKRIVVTLIMLITGANNDSYCGNLLDPVEEGNNKEGNIINDAPIKQRGLPNIENRAVIDTDQSINNNQNSDMGNSITVNPIGERGERGERGNKKRGGNLLDEPSPEEKQTTQEEPTILSTIATKKQTKPIEVSNINPDELNRALGLPIFSTSDLWDEPVSAIAKRLNIPSESSTSYESSYRKFDLGKTNLGGVKVYGTHLRGERGQPTELSFMFTNKGDLATLKKEEEENLRKNRRSSRDPQEPSTQDLMEKLTKDMAEDYSVLSDALTGMLGTPKNTSHDIAGEIKESGLTWDYGNHSIFLTSVENNYVALRILPSENNTRQTKNDKKTKFDESKYEVENRIIKKENGDTYLEVPMINQGAKGYCAPATYARVLLYYNIPVDINLLAKAAGTSAGGGTSVQAMEEAVYPLLKQAGAKVYPRSCGVTIEEIKAHIDKGEPLIWTVKVSNTFADRVTERNREREGVTNWHNWMRRLSPDRSIAYKLENGGTGHQDLIIGYNEETQEIAISDSYGEKFAVRWILPEEARAISIYPCTVITR